MILHIGNDMALNTDNIIAVVGADFMEKTHGNTKFLKRALEQKRFFSCEKECKSYIIAMDCGIEKIYQSPISLSTLHKRANITGGI